MVLPRCTCVAGRAPLGGGAAAQWMQAAPGAGAAAVSRQEAAVLPGAGAGGGCEQPPAQSQSEVAEGCVSLLGGLGVVLRPYTPKRWKLRM